MGWRDREYAEDDDEAALDDPDAPDESDTDEDGDDDETILCPFCHKAVYEAAEICPHCRNYLSDEEAPRRRSPIIWAGAILALLGMLWGIIWWFVRWVV